jgi:hypothetical protein
MCDYFTASRQPGELPQPATAAPMKEGYTKLDTAINDLVATTSPRACSAPPCIDWRPA